MGIRPKVLLIHWLVCLVDEWQQMILEVLSRRSAGDHRIEPLFLPDCLGDHSQLFEAAMELLAMPEQFPCSYVQPLTRPELVRNAAFGFWSPPRQIVASSSMPLFGGRMNS